MKSKYILKDLIESIVCGELEKDSKFPSEANLAQKYECNRHTIRKVMDVLIERGYVRKSHGGPTYINELPSTYSLNLSSKYDIYSAKDINTCPVSIHLTGCLFSRTLLLVSLLILIL